MCASLQTVVLLRSIFARGKRAFSTSIWLQEKKNYKLVVVGGGAGGCSMAAKFASKLGKGKLAIIEPNLTHYYQPMWTLVGGGAKTLQQSQRPMSDVLPVDADWIKDRVLTFNPERSVVVTEKGLEVQYDYLIIGMGLQLDFEKIKGFPKAFETPGVCSNYSATTVEKTFKAIREFKGGNAIFTLPNTAIKCPGAPQKIMYLADDYFRKKGKRKSANIMFNTSLDVIFIQKKYANQLLKVAEARDIKLNFKHNLIEVRTDEKEAVFEKLGTDKTTTFKYDLLHVTPPMSAPDPLKKSPLADQLGYLELNIKTLQHVKYPNIFGIGDCTNLPTPRTAAAVAAEGGILRRNLTRFMEGKSLTAEFDGYTSCPLVTRYGRCILAEFDYNLQPLETFPIDQGKERMSMYYMKKDFLPQLYWSQLLRGKWEGPEFVRKLAHLGMNKK